jgi:hypothetical protein
MWTIGGNQHPELVGAERTTPGQINANETAGYVWDPVKRAWGPKGTSVNAINGLLGGLTGSGGAGGAGGALGGLNGLLPGGGGTGSTGSVGPLAMPDTSAADTANLNRTKDTVGQQSASALRGLRESLGARGMLGSGLESRGTEQIAEAGLGEMGDVARQQQIDNSNRTQHTAEVNYQGALTQRGQDIQAAEAAAQRNQTVLLGLLKTLGTGAGAGLSY